MVSHTPTVKEPMHLLLLRAAIYAGVMLLVVVPLADTAGMIAALVAVPLATFLGAQLAATRLRLPVMLAGLGVAILVGFLGIHLLDNSVWLAELLGLNASLIIRQVLIWGGGTLGIVFGLRLLATRVPTLAILEIAAMAAVVVYLFAGHRNEQIDQPRDFSDWAFSQGHDPKMILIIIGVITMAGLALLLFEKQTMTRTLGAAAFILVLGLVAHWVVVRFEKADDPNIQPRGQAKGKQQTPPKPPTGRTLPSDIEDSDNDDLWKVHKRHSGAGAGSNPVVAVVTFEEDFQAFEAGGIYFRKRSLSRFGGKKMLPANFPGMDNDTQAFFPIKKMEIAAGSLAVTVPGMGKLKLFKMVPTKVALLRDVGCLALIKPMTLEPRTNPNPKRFRISYQVVSGVLSSTMTVYLPSNIALDSLRKAGIPETVVGKLQRFVEIQGYYASEELFLRQLRYSLTTDEVAKYSAQLLKLAQIEQRINPYDLLKTCPAGEFSWSPAMRRLYLECPKDERYRKLADEIIKDKVPAGMNYSPLLKALAFQDWIYHNTKYTKFREHGGADPIASYLFGDRKGKCVHIAHAMTYLLRSQGIPARVAEGFLVPAKRRGRGLDVAIQRSDAHAWCEMHLQGVGWIVMDAFSKINLDPPIDEPSKKVQEQLGKENREEDKIEKQEESDPRLAEKGRVLLGWLLILPPVVLLGLYGIKAWRRLAPRIAREKSLYRHCYRAALDRLAEVGLTRRFGETREEFAERIAPVVPDFVTLSDGHVREAVAGLPTFERQTWLQLKAHMDAALTKTFSRARRFLGLANPVSWLWAK